MVGPMNTNIKQKICIITPPILIVLMYFIFQWLTGIFSDRIAWFLGLAIYWMLWGIIFPILMLGKDNLLKLIRPQKPDFKIILLVTIPLVITLIGRFIPSMEYEKPTIWIFLLLIVTAFGNGFFEEVFWRGVYLHFFTDNIVFRMILPSLWFGIWHYAPGSVMSDSVITLMIGAGIFGLFLSYLAKRNNTIWWPIITHFLSGIIAVV